MFIRISGSLFSIFKYDKNKFQNLELGNEFGIIEELEGVIKQDPFFVKKIEYEKLGDKTYKVLHLELK